MAGQSIEVHLKTPTDPRRIRQLLEDAGFEVDVLTEVRGGVFNAVDLVSFVVDHLDEALIGVLAGVVANWVAPARERGAISGDRAVGFSIKDSEHITVINVTGDGNWVQVHPRPEPSADDE